MPQRFLRPGITTSDAWNAVSFEAQSLYVRLLTLVDDFGRYDGRCAILHGQCFALRPDITPKKTAALRSELQQAALVHVYVVDGKEYIQLTKWQERTRVDKSKYPAPETPLPSAAECCDPQEKDASSISSSLAIISSPLPPAAPWMESFNAFWSAYPKKEAKGDAEKAWKNMKCTPLLDVILAAVEKGKQWEQWRKNGGQFIPHPATWLNRKGWEDEMKSEVLPPAPPKPYKLV